MDQDNSPGLCCWIFSLDDQTLKIYRYSGREWWSCQRTPTRVFGRCSKVQPIVKRKKGKSKHSACNGCEYIRTVPSICARVSFFFCFCCFLPTVFSTLDGGADLHYLLHGICHLSVKLLLILRARLSSSTSSRLNEVTESYGLSPTHCTHAFELVNDIVRGYPGKPHGGTCIWNFGYFTHTNSAVGPTSLCDNSPACPPNPGPPPPFTNYT